MRAFLNLGVPKKLDPKEQSMIDSSFWVKDNVEGTCFS